MCSVVCLVNICTSCRCCTRELLLLRGCLALLNGTLLLWLTDAVMPRTNSR